MKKLLIVIVMLVGLLLAGCNSPFSDKYYVALNEPFYLSIGKSAQINEIKMSIKFDSVQEDSRCPLGVQCVWAGRVIVKLVINIDGKEEELLIDNSDYSTAPNFGQYKIQLTKIDPPKSETMKGYKIELLITNPI